MALSLAGCEEIAAVLLLSLYKQTFLLLQADHDNRSINLSGQDAIQPGRTQRQNCNYQTRQLLSCSAAPPPPCLLLLLLLRHRRRRLNKWPAIETRRSLGTIINGEINFGAFSQFQ